jgi:hypothetical protein
MKAEDQFIGISIVDMRARRTAIRSTIEELAMLSTSVIPAEFHDFRDHLKSALKAFDEASARYFPSKPERGS